MNTITTITKITANFTHILVLFISGGAILVFLSLIRLLPFSARLVSSFNAYMIDPPLFGSKHASPILNFAIVSNGVQALFLTYIVAINIALSGVNLLVPQRVLSHSFVSAVKGMSAGMKEGRWQPPNKMIGRRRDVRLRR